MHELGRMRNGSKQEPRADINFKRGIRKKILWHYGLLTDLQLTARCGMKTRKLNAATITRRDRDKHSERDGMAATKTDECGIEITLSSISC